MIGVIQQTSFSIYLNTQTRSNRSSNYLPKHSTLIECVQTRSLASLVAGGAEGHAQGHRRREDAAQKVRSEFPFDRTFETLPDSATHFGDP